MEDEDYLTLTKRLKSGFRIQGIECSWRGRIGLFCHLTLVGTAAIRQEKAMCTPALDVLLCEMGDTWLPSSCLQAAVLWQRCHKASQAVCKEGQEITRNEAASLPSFFLIQPPTTGPTRPPTWHALDPWGVAFSNDCRC